MGGVWGLLPVLLLFARFLCMSFIAEISFHCNNWVMRHGQIMCFCCVPILSFNLNVTYATGKLHNPKTLHVARGRPEDQRSKQCITQHKMQGM